MSKLLSRLFVLLLPSRRDLLDNVVMEINPIYPQTTIVRSILEAKIRSIEDALFLQGFDATLAVCIARSCFSYVSHTTRVELEAQSENIREAGGILDNFFFEPGESLLLNN